jgi:cell division protein FtsI (penicillin-binding protein 3)
VMLRARWMVRIFAAALLGTLLGLFGRLVWLHVATAPEASARQARQSTTAGVRLARRGSVCDRRGQPLAQSVEEVQVTVWPPKITDGPKGPRSQAEVFASLTTIGEFLEPIVGVPAEQLAPAMLATDRNGRPRNARLGAPVTDPLLIDRLLAERERARGALRRVDLEHDWQREYPFGACAGPLLGFVNHDGFGGAGLEHGLDEILGCTVSGTLPRRHGAGSFAMADALREPLEPLDGFDVLLTLDVVAQQMVEEELNRSAAELHATGGSAVLIEVATGDVLALASTPGLDPTDTRTWTAAGQVLRPVQTVYSPGSTFKPFMLAAALDLGLVQPGSRVNCKPDSGRDALFGKRRIKDTHPEHYPANGMLSLEQILVESSNVGMARILTSLLPAGHDRDTELMRPIYDVIRALGVGQPTGVPVAAEAAGLYTPLSRWSRNQTLASVAFGHEVAVTPLQMAAITASLADGCYRAPRLVRAYRDQHGNRTEMPLAPATRVFSAAHADMVRTWMRAVVDTGAAKCVSVPGVPVSGKTGTTVDERDKSKETHSFIALVPTNAPVIALVVVLEQPKGHRYAAQTVAPPTGRILNRVVPYLGIAGGTAGGLAAGIAQGSLASNRP